MTLIPSRNRAGIAIIVVEATVSFFAIVAVALRVWARKLKGARLDASDWTCIAALVGHYLYY